MNLFPMILLILYIIIYLEIEDIVFQKLHDSTMIGKNNDQKTSL